MEYLIALIRSPRWLLVATTMSFALLLIPNLSEGVQGSWTEQIAHHLREEKNQSHQEELGAVYDRYLAQLEVVDQAYQVRNVPEVKKELNRLVQMIAAREGGISQSSALSLIFYISEVTPPVYHDETMKSHFRLVQRLFTSKAEESLEPPIDSGYGSAVPARTVPWGLNQYGWLGEIWYHPMFILGLGVLVLVVVGSLVFLFLGLRGGNSENKPSIRIKPKQLRLR